MLWAHVLYPGLEGHPGHEAAVRQMSGFGGMVSFRAVRSGRDSGHQDHRSWTRLFTLAESLGAVESLIEHPGAVTRLSAEGSLARGVPDDLVGSSPSGSRMPPIWSPIWRRPSTGGSRRAP